MLCCPSSTAQQDADAVTELLQRRGVTAAPCAVRRAASLSSSYFMARGLYCDIDRPALGAAPIFNLMWNRDKALSTVRRRAPLLGEHNRPVLGELPGLNDDELADLAGRCLRRAIKLRFAVVRRVVSSFRR